MFSTVHDQVLISEMGNEPKEEENKKRDAKKPSTKDDKAKGSSDSHVELDSRLLSALLTVST